MTAILKRTLRVTCNLNWTNSKIARLTVFSCILRSLQSPSWCWRASYFWWTGYQARTLWWRQLCFTRTPRRRRWAAVLYRGSVPKSRQPIEELVQTTGTKSNVETLPEFDNRSSPPRSTSPDNRVPFEERTSTTADEMDGKASKLSQTQ